MKIVGMMPVRNEAWCLGLSARVALKWCDQLVILDHASTDGSRDIERQLAREYGRRITIVCEDDPAWDEMRHRQILLREARVCGATHLAIVDADEVMTANLIGQLPAIYANCFPGQVLQFPGYNLRGSLDRYHANGTWSKRWFSVLFRDDPRLSWQGDQFHHREPFGLHLRAWKPIEQGGGGVMHLWGVSERRLLAKHAWYKITERLRWPGKHRAQVDLQYSMAVKGTGGPDTPANWIYSHTAPTWWEGHADLVQYLHIDSVPWQERAIADAIERHGRSNFEGLDLFGY